MNWRSLGTIIRKDLTVIGRSKVVLIPMIVLPVVFFVLLPALVFFIPVDADLNAGPMQDIKSMLDNMPDGLLESLDGLTDAETIVVLVLVYMFAPMFLIVPLMIASTIAADSFAGEKERKTLEALLYSPTTDQELFLGKVLAAWLPAVGVAVLGFVLYGLVANIAAWPIMGRLFFPSGMWIALVFWVAPGTAGLGLSTVVLVSSRVGGFQEAYQLGGAVVIPILLLLFGQISGVLVFNIWVVLSLGVFLWLVDGVLLWLGVRTLQRAELIARIQ